MEKVIREMYNSLEEDCYIAFISANDDYDFGLRKRDNFHFLDDKTLIIHRKSGRTTIINLNLIIGICIKQELF